MSDHVKTAMVLLLLSQLLHHTRGIISNLSLYPRSSINHPLFYSFVSHFYRRYSAVCPPHLTWHLTIPCPVKTTNGALNHAPTNWWLVKSTEWEVRWMTLTLSWRIFQCLAVIYTILGRWSIPGFGCLLRSIPACNDYGRMRDTLFDGESFHWWRNLAMTSIRGDKVFPVSLRWLDTWILSRI